MGKHDLSGKLVLVVSIWLRDNDVRGFEAFESRVASIMARYGGAIERAIRLDEADRKPDDPFEIHLVSFPSEESFAAYRHDPEIVVLKEEREAIIARTEIRRGAEIREYARDLFVQ